MAVDGSLKFDTKIDDSGFSDGVSRLSSMAAKGLAAISGAVAGMSAYAIKVGSNFEAGMSEVSAISGATGEDLEMLTDKAKEMGIQTKFSATEASEAMQYMAMAGWKAADMAEGISGIMDLAAASGEDLASVSDIVTDALTAFGLQASDSGHFADVLAKAASNSNTNVGMMGATFKYAAPLAGTLGYSIEDTAVAIGLMANAGIKGEQAGTAMRGMLTRLIKPTDEVQGSMDALGITITNTDGTIKPLNQLMKEMRKSFANLTDEEKAQRAASLAGQEAMSGFLAIINASDSDFDNLTDAINNAEGAASEMAETMNDNLKGKVTLLGSSLEGVGIAAYEKFERPLKDAVEGAIDKVNDLSDSMASGELSDSMDTVAEGLGSIVDTTLDLATGAIPLVIDGFAFVVDHGNTIIPVLAGIGAGMIAINTAESISTGLRTASTAATVLYATAQNVLAGSLTLAEGAQMALNVAMGANPFGMAAIAIGAVVGGLTALCIGMGSANGNLKEHKENVEAAKNAYNDLKQSHQEMLESSLSDISYYENLKNKLDQIVDSSGNVKAGYEGLAGYIVGELNQAIGTNMEIIDGQIVKYEEMSGKIDEYLLKMRASAIVEAQAEQLKKAEAQYKSNSDEIASINEDMAKKQEWLNAKMDELRENGLTDEQIAKDTVVRILRGEVADYQNQKDDLMAIQQTLITDKQTVYDNMAAMQRGSVEDFKKISASEISEYDENGNLVVKTLEEKYQSLLAEREAYVIAIEKATDEETKKGLTAELETIDKKIDLKEQEMEAVKQVVQDNEPGIIDSYENISERSLNVMDISPELGKLGQENVLSFSNGMELKKDSTKKSGKRIAKEGVEGAKEGSAGFEGVGKNSAEGFANGMTLPEALSSVISSARSMMQTALKAAKDEGVIRSPSHVFRDEVGYMAGAGLAVGMDKSEGLIAKSARNMVQSALDETSHMKKLLQDDMVVDFSTSFDSLRGVAIQHATTMPFSASNNVYNSYENNTDPIDYDKLGKSIVDAINEGGFPIELDYREIGRLGKGRR